MANSDLQITFLTDGGQQAAEVASQLGSFLDTAQRSLDICIYDANLPGPPGETVSSALQSAVRRGVDLRIAYFATGAPSGDDMTATFVRPFGDRARPIHAVRGLMHDKYVIRDAETQNAAVWTG